MYISLLWLLFWTGAFPLWHAWRATRRTSLIHAANWMIISWVAWGWAWAMACVHQPVLGVVARYFALCLTGCAGVAVLGARRPGVGAWNFVVVGLLAVQLLPLAEGALTGDTLQLGGFRTLFLAATLAVGLLNYLPTRLAAAAVLVGLGCAGHAAALVAGERVGNAGSADGWFSAWLLAGAPWVAWVALRTRPTPAAEFDRRWLDFRDRFGFVWAQRLREQFNHAARHAGWPVILRWQGLRLLPGATFPRPDVQAALLATLGALMKRFGPEAPPDATAPGRSGR